MHPILAVKIFTGPEVSAEHCPSIQETDQLNATTFWRTAAVVRNWSDVLQKVDTKSNRRKGAYCTLATRTRAFDEN